MILSQPMTDDIPAELLKDAQAWRPGWEWEDLGGELFATLWQDQNKWLDDMGSLGLSKRDGRVVASLNSVYIGGFECSGEAVAQAVAEVVATLQRAIIRIEARADGDASRERLYLVALAMQE